MKLNMNITVYKLQLLNNKNILSKNFRRSTTNSTNSKWDEYSCVENNNLQAFAISSPIMTKSGSLINIT